VRGGIAVSQGARVMTTCTRLSLRAHSINQRTYCLGATGNVVEMVMVHHKL